MMAVFILALPCLTFAAPALQSAVVVVSLANINHLTEEELVSVLAGTDAVPIDYRNRLASPYNNKFGTGVDKFLVIKPSLVCAHGHAVNGLCPDHKALRCIPTRTCRRQKLGALGFATMSMPTGMPTSCMPTSLPFFLSSKLNQEILGHCDLSCHESAKIVALSCKALFLAFQALRPLKVRFPRQ
jgi:hypothetical protein